MTEKTILIVEDNDVQREGLAAVLRNEGNTVIVAASGKEALSVVGTVLPDLILVDMLMPPPDGWILMRLWKINSELASVPVVIVTSLGIASEEWAASLGACGLIRKPVETEPLLREVRRCIGERHG
jgi:two-component system, chemotaxis family, chemotaxis protein CheY